MLKEIRDLGFQWVELGHGIRYSLWPGVLKAAEQGLVQFSSLHNFCPVPVGVFHPSPNCFQFSDPRELERNQAIQATKETIQQAEALGARAVVLHLGWAGPKNISKKLEAQYQAGKIFNRAYIQTKIKAVAIRKKLWPKLWPRIQSCLEPLVAFAAEKKVQLGFECREIFEEFPHETEMDEVLRAFPTETVGYWHDFGHAARKDFLGWHTHEETLALRQNRLIGCHIHDCAPPHFDHLPLGKGLIDFPNLARLIRPNCIQVLELSPRTKAEDVIACRQLWNSYVAT